MREAINFTFNGVPSEDMGVSIASTSGGLFEESFFANRKITEQEVRGRSKRYFQRVDSDPLSFSLTFFIHDWKKRDNLRQIARWLYQDYYKPLFPIMNDKIAFANYLSGVGINTVSTPELQDFIRQYAKNLKDSAAHMNTGGYTGKFSGGKLAVLHEEEVVLNKPETRSLFKALPSLERLAALLPVVKTPSLPTLQPDTGIGIGSPIVNFNIENMNGTQQEADNFANKFFNSLKRDKGVRR